MMKIIVAAVMGLVLTASAAQAFDCSKAKTKIEKAICAHPDLTAADDAMAAAYDRLRSSLTGNYLKTLSTSQRKWVKGREDQCGYLDGGELTDCIRAQTENRRRLLAGEAESGPGASSPMIPVFIEQNGAAKRYDIDYTLIKFAKPASPGEKLFNAEVDKIAKEAPLGPTTNEAPEGATLSASAAMAVAYASPQLVSASNTIWSFDGGAHGNGGLSNINIDLGKGRMIESKDIFNAAAIKKLTGDCTAQIAKQKTGKLQIPFNPADDPNYDAAEIGKHIADMTRWTLRAGKVTVTFDPYAIGSYAEGSYTCDFVMDNLRAAAKPGAPLPQQE
jgi:uncharacterized protein YecT (DUF1311 family)